MPAICRILVASGFLLAFLPAGSALAQFARPPGDEPPPYDDSPPRSEPPLAAEPRSTVRVNVGPALLFKPATPGLFAALDIGRRAVGARFSGAWLNAETKGGLAQYGAELWIDFGAGTELHPIVGAGAALVSGEQTGQDESAGAGTLRGAIEYQLPVEDAEARVGLSLIALVPAINSQRDEPWVMGALTVSAGF
ncbi:MAG TPA: hypothetical protein VGP93_15700 [Polyangiaceae bacterium]|jgi:hypothetical protein|nr:hypothetical protein [Polyangiaceae bacterium]